MNFRIWLFQWLDFVKLEEFFIINICMKNMIVYDKYDFVIIDIFIK